MLDNLKSKAEMDSDGTIISRNLLALGILLTYLAALFVQNSYKLSLRVSTFFTIVMLMHMVLHWFSESLFKRRYWLYFILQGIIVFYCTVIMPSAYEPIFLGLIPLLIFQSVMVYYELIKVVITSLYFYGIFCGIIIVLLGFKELIRYIPILIIITIAVRAFLAAFLEQVRLRVQTQKYLKELELAYEKVEELTLINERQRMARDLHDTLSQGLAGLIMQLEAVSANLSRDNSKRAQEIVEKSMEHARKTLSDARLVIHDLRTHEIEDVDLCKAVDGEIAIFKAVSNASVTVNINVKAQLSSKIFKHIIYIVREGLSNIAKHSGAENALVSISETDKQIQICIKDDGIGFDIKLLNKQFGHYGILGITERVKAIHGSIKINSERKEGTEINITIPIEKGLEEGNE